MGRPWRVVGADASLVGAGGSGGGLGGCGTLLLQMNLCVWARGFVVAAYACGQEQFGPSWKCSNPSEVSKGSWWLKLGFFLEIRVLERERSCCVGWSRGLAQQCEGDPTSPLYRWED